MNSQQYKSGGEAGAARGGGGGGGESAASGDESSATARCLRSESPSSPTPADADGVDSDDELLDMSTRSDDQATPEAGVSPRATPISSPDLHVTSPVSARAGEGAVSDRVESPPVSKPIVSDQHPVLPLPRFPYPPISLPGHAFPFAPSMLSALGAGHPTLGLHAPLPFHPHLGLLSHHLMFTGAHPTFQPPPPPGPQGQDPRS